jgi:hypothetical protein
VVCKEDGGETTPSFKLTLLPELIICSQKHEEYLKLQSFIKDLRKCKKKLIQAVLKVLGGGVKR